MESREECLKEAVECDRLAGLANTEGTRRIMMVVAFNGASWRKRQQTVQRSTRTQQPKRYSRVGETGMANSRTRRFLIEIRDAKGAPMFRSVAYWDEKDTRIAIARITQLAGLPDVNVRPEPQLEPKRGKE